MNTIQEIKNWPNDCIVEAVQGKITKSYDRREVNTANGAKSVQSAEFQDSGGNKIRVTAWEHPDLKALEGKEIIIHSTKAHNGKFGGVKVQHGSYVAKKDGGGHKAGDTIKTLELSVSKSGAFQSIEVYRQSNPNSTGGSGANAQVQNAPVQIQSAPSRFHGATVGMAVKAACENLTQRGNALTVEAIKEIASIIIKASNELEFGTPAPAESAPVKEEVPF